MRGMGISVARLRVGLVVGVALLAVVVGGFLGYARYRTHRFLAGLPGRLGVDVRRETNGYTYSQSVGGKTVMTLHAAKAVERSNGKITLHDVSMILYGRKQDRADRISGSEFEYEQASGVVRAVGEVDIDLQAPVGAGHQPPEPTKEDGPRMVHVKTSGLVFLQKLGVAATDQDLEFRFGEMTGHAKGAEYNADTGILILQAAVRTSGMQHGRPVALAASHAELNRQTQVTLLTDARYNSPGETARGDHATVYLRGEGSPERIQAEGHVAVSSPRAGTVTAPQAELRLGAAGQAQGVHFFGGVVYSEDTSLRQGQGAAREARVAFGATGHPETVVLTGAVYLKERVRGTTANASWSTREGVAESMTVVLGDEGRQLRSVEAETGARMTLVSEAPMARSEIAGDRLHGEFTGTGRSVQLSKIRGSGHTFLRRVVAQSAEQTSTGDTLEVNLRQGLRGGAQEIAQAVQSGHVAMMSKASAKAGSDVPKVERASAELAVYDGDAAHLTLTGHAQVTDESGTVTAGKIVMEHGNGDATAEGTVKATYLQPGRTEPVHVQAERAAMQHEAERALFYGVAGRPARLWQGASQVEAPVLDLERESGRLTARSEAGEVAPVHAVLVGQATEGLKTASVMRIASRSMVYLDAERQVEFNGGVKVDDARGTLRAAQATAYLQAKPEKSGAASDAVPATSKKDAKEFFGGGVERIVATGKIDMEQPGRRAAGERLVYTSSDGAFVLTGTVATPPTLTDDAQGTVTGQSLRFLNGDRSVVVTGGDGKQTSQRVHTVTRVKPR